MRRCRRPGRIGCLELRGQAFSPVDMDRRVGFQSAAPGRHGRGRHPCWVVNAYTPGWPVHSHRTVIGQAGCAAEAGELSGLSMFLINLVGQP